MTAGALQESPWSGVGADCYAGGVGGWGDRGDAPRLHRSAARETRLGVAGESFPGRTSRSSSLCFPVQQAPRRAFRGDAPRLHQTAAACPYPKALTRASSLESLKPWWLTA